MARAAPQVQHLEAAEVPVWRSNAGDRVRVVVGSFNAVSSPLVPAEPFTLLDIQLRHEISLPLPAEHNTVVYVLTGTIVVGADGHTETVEGGHALAIGGDGGRVSFDALRPAHFLPCRDPNSTSRW